MAVTGTHFDLKTFVDKSRGNVLFAEADGDFVEVLFSFLTLPLGTIARLIAKIESEPASTLGCFGSLYQSVTSLANEHFCAEEFKDMLLHPLSSSEDMCRRLKINIDDTAATYYLCPHTYYKRCSCYMSLYNNTKCSCCGFSMTQKGKLEASEHGSKGKVFVSKALKFIITDNLQVTPLVAGTFIGYLSNLGTIAPSMIDERTVKLGLNELIRFLKCTLHSTTPLTDLFGAKTKLPLSSVPKKASLQMEHSGEGRKINVKLVLNKSRNEFLFAEAGKDFIDFLFSLLLIPLGEMLHILEGQTGLGCIDDLYKSAQSLDSKHFSSEQNKNILLMPKLPPHFICKNHLFPLQSTPIKSTICGIERTMPMDSVLMGDLGSGGFVREEGLFIVLDNLTVTPFSAAAAISTINMHKTSFSDLEEKRLSIGLAEGISILRASLNSTSAISIGLLPSSLVFKEPKQEK